MNLYYTPDYILSTELKPASLSTCLILISYICQFRLVITPKVLQTNV